jgi:predicted PurR-regulated permease PerM
VTLDEAGPRREWLAWGAGLLVLVVLLYTLREVLSPPLVLPLFLAVLWPLRRRPGMAALMTGAVLLTVYWLLALYGGFLGPFVCAVVVAYLMAPLVDRLTARRVPRGVAIVLVGIVPLVLIGLMVAIAGPQVWDQVLALGAKVPRVAENVVAWLQGMRDRIANLPFLTAAQRSRLDTLDAQTVRAFLQSHTDEIVGRLGGWGLSLVGQVGTLLGFIGYLVITPVVAFYLVNDWGALIRSIEGMVPPARRPGLNAFLGEYDRAVGRWLRGQLLEATICGTLTTVGLLILGIPSALLLGLIAGAFNLIPFIGFAISLVPALLVALAMDDPGSGLLRVLLVFGVVNFIDANITGPRLVGGSVGLHPVATMLAMAIGGALLGLVGFLLAVPLAVLARMLMQRLMVRYKASGVYGAEVGSQ